MVRIHPRSHSKAHGVVGLGYVGSPHFRYVVLRSITRVRQKRSADSRIQLAVGANSSRAFKGLIFLLEVPLSSQHIQLPVDVFSLIDDPEIRIDNITVT